MRMRTPNGTATTFTESAGAETAESRIENKSHMRGRLGVLALGSLIIGACGASSSPTEAGEPSEVPSAPTGASSLDAGDVCTAAQGSITVYSGRNENLVGELYSQFTMETGVVVESRFGDSGELAGQILTEAGSSPADVFFSQDAGALGAVAQAGLLSEIDDVILDRVSDAFKSSEGLWVGTSGRVRVVVYNPELAPTPPSTIDEILEPIWKGRIGFAPTNASWQSFVTALRVLRGDDAAREWLEAFAANEPKAYEKNAAVRDAVDIGEVAIGLVNHYYLYEKIAAEGPDAVIARNKYMSPGDPGGLVNVAGTAVLSSTDNPSGAACFISYLLSEKGQSYFVEKTYEYPLVAGVDAYEGLPAFESLDPPSIDLSDLSTIAETQELLADVGLLTL